MSFKSRFAESLFDDTVRCTICPRKCVVKIGERGFCGSKENQKGSLISLTYGLLSAFAVDPIEKKPLFHFYPGSNAFSISSVGCSFTCPWCQNWHLSTARAEDQLLRYVSPDEVVAMSLRRGCNSIAYTYNEPLINLNYVEDVSRLARKEDIKNVLVTNGYISSEALDQVVDVIDAANVDWKSLNEDFYRKYCSADLSSVIDATAHMKKKGVHVEVTFLMIPEVNDDEKETIEMAQCVRDVLGSDVPLHLSRFFPQYKFSHIHPTPMSTLIRARELAMIEGLQYVFIGNTPFTEYENTICPECKKPIVERRGYKIERWNLDSENKCTYCGYKIPIIRKLVS